MYGPYAAGGGTTVRAKLSQASVPLHLGEFSTSGLAGMTAPLPGPMHSHREKLAELADLGYTDIWSAEADGADAFTPLALDQTCSDPND